MENMHTDIKGERANIQQSGNSLLAKFKASYWNNNFLYVSCGH